MNKFDLILYDLDGTVWDSIPIIMDSFHHAYEAVLGRCDRSDEDLMSYIGKPLDVTFNMHDEKTAKALLDEYLDYNHKLLADDAIQMFPGVTDSLKRIRSAGIRQGVVTSKRGESALPTLKFKGLDDFFDVYVYKEDTYKHKPDAEPLIYAARKMGIADMSRVIYVGDALPDALCAVNAGSAFALVSWSKMDKEQIMKEAPDRSIVIDTLDELITKCIDCNPDSI
ncbi:MAG: HAD-IA family hydrolase [Saccharofermentans sp.]|nr:HAD-IA family hydrolase [Saccharofermentans sp.]